MEQTTRFFVSIPMPGVYRPDAPGQRLAACRDEKIRSGRGVQGESALSSEKTQKPDMTSKAAAGKKVHSKDQDMGTALRTVFQKTVDEGIPPEMLDLLGKLD
jgi:hypothetical protein